MFTLLQTVKRNVKEDVQDRTITIGAITIYEPIRLLLDFGRVRYCVKIYDIARKLTLLACNFEANQIARFSF